jgi:hypothetical protein
MRQASWQNELLLPGRFYAVARFARRIAVVTALLEKQASVGPELRLLSHHGMSIVERNLQLAVHEALAQSSLAIVRPDAHIARTSL